MTLSSFYNFTSGYGNILESILENFPKKGIDVFPRSFSVVSDRFKKYFHSDKRQSSDLDLLICTPYKEIDMNHPLFHVGPHKNRSLFTMWESTRTNDLFIDHVNKNNSLVVPNKWNKENFYNQRVDIPIHTVPLFCDTSVFKFSQNNLSEVFTFGSANGDPRKRIEDVIYCFSKAFKKSNKDVRLKIKITERDSLKLNVLDDRIEIVRCDFTKDEMKNWYDSINVFVSCCSAEGWGMMQQESMCCGRPVICSNYAGLREFVTEDNSFCVGYDEEYSTGFWDSGGKWSKYKEEEMIEKMRYCFNNREEVKKKSIVSSNDASVFNEENFIYSLIKVLNL